MIYIFLQVEKFRDFKMEIFKEKIIQSEIFVIGEKNVLGIWSETEYKGINCWLFKILGVQQKKDVIIVHHFYHSLPNVINYEDLLIDEGDEVVAFRSLKKGKYIPTCYYSEVKPAKK